MSFTGAGIPSTVVFTKVGRQVTVFLWKFQLNQTLSGNTSPFTFVPANAIPSTFLPFNAESLAPGALYLPVIATNRGVRMSSIITIPTDTINRLTLSTSGGDLWSGICGIDMNGGTCFTYMAAS